VISSLSLSISLLLLQELGSSVFSGESDASGIGPGGVKTVTVPRLIPAEVDGEPDKIEYRTETVSCESEARQLLAELTGFNSYMSSATMADQVATAKRIEKNKATSAEIAKIKADLEAIRQRLATEPKSIVTTSSRADEARLFYEGLIDTHNSIFGGPSEAPPQLTAGAGTGAVAGAGSMMMMAIDDAEAENGGIRMMR
jgi:hypothetical protein